LLAWGAWSPKCTRGPVWQVKLKTVPYGHDIGKAWSKPPADGSRGSWDVGEEPVAGLGSLELEMHRGRGRFGRQN
jgi:hypothetical protein